MAARVILGIFSHPDDECMGPGGTLAKYVDMGHRVAFVTATDGGAGRLHERRPADNRTLRRTRRAETEAAARILGVEFLGFLDWEDGALVELNVLDVEERIAALIRRERPDVVLTFHGSGISYHPDHRVLTLATTGAFFGAARRAWYRSDVLASLPPHAAQKLYHYVPEERTRVDVSWPRAVYVADAAEVTTVIDTSAHQDRRWEAIAAHDTQRDGPPFRSLYEAGHFARESFVRIVPSPGVGEDVETDLLAGL